MLGSSPVTYPPRFLQGQIFSPPSCPPASSFDLKNLWELSVCTRYPGRTGPAWTDSVSSAVRVLGRQCWGPGGTGRDGCTAVPRGWRVSAAGVTGCTGSGLCSLLPLCRQQGGGAGETDCHKAGTGVKMFSNEQSSQLAVPDRGHGEGKF